jgi:hypothetical protein
MRCLKSSAVELEALNSRLKTSLHPPGRVLATDNQDLHRRADESGQVADELIAVLDRLKVGANCQLHKNEKLQTSCEDNLEQGKVASEYDEIKVH